MLSSLWKHPWEWVARQDTSFVGNHDRAMRDENEYWQEGCIFRDKDNTENCSNPGITFLISFALFFISRSMLGTNKSHDVELWLTHHSHFLSRGVVLKYVFGWASRQFSLLPLVSVNKRGLFSQPFGGLFLIRPRHYWFFSFPFPQHPTRQCLVFVRSIYSTSINSEPVGPGTTLFAKMNETQFLLSSLQSWEKERYRKKIRHEVSVVI